MLDDICPVQFIEGVNEDGEIRKGGNILIDHLHNIAIGFTPRRTFLLNRIEVNLVWKGSIEPVEYDAKLYPDYHNNPASIVLREGKLIFNETRSGVGWCNIDLNQPVVVFAGDNYWLGLESWEARFSLLQVNEGKKSVPFSEGEPGDWHSSTNVEYQFMLRLYGRVVPAVS
jgi:hypothetical protein